MLAFVRSVDEASAALAAGAERAVVVIRPAGLAVTPPQPVQHGVGVLFDSDGFGDQRELVQRARAAGFLSLWLPLEPRWQTAIQAASGAGLQVIAIVDPSQALDHETCAQASRAGCSALLIEGLPFSRQRLLDRRTVPSLAAMHALCRKWNLDVVFAGAIEPPDVPRLLALRPDAIGLDTALRDADDRLDLARIRDLVALTAADQPSDGSAAGEASRPDRIFVRDWIVPMSIGAYLRERGEKQRVAFHVEAVVTPFAPDAGIAGTVSYDLITDAIARLAAEHVDLVETIAEELATAVLAHARVSSVAITIEKLDVGPGRVGCSILRRRRPI